MDSKDVETKKKKRSNTSRGFSLIDTIIIIIVTAIISGATTGVILFNTYGEKTGVSYSELANDAELKEFLEVYNKVGKEYYQSVNKKEMLQAAIKAMMKYLGDDYTTYLDENETNVLDETLSGKYEGIGVLVRDKVIVSVFNNSPAQKAGLLVNDKITKVNDTDCENLSNTEIVALIKNDKKKVHLEVLRNGEKKSFDLELNVLNAPAISYEVKENNIGYIYISTFSNTLSEQVKEALVDLHKKNISNIIVDVRDNSGGYLVQAYEVASMFIEKGKPIYSLESNSNISTYYDETNEKENYKMVVLINKNSASASEILAAALKESYGAILVGETSFGKGKVQQTKKLSDGTKIKYTTAKWLTPSKNCIDSIGLEPDYKIDIEYIYENDKIVDYKDTQLNKAIELLK